MVVVYITQFAPSPPKKSPEIARFQGFFSFFSHFLLYADMDLTLTLTLADL